MTVDEKKELVEKYKSKFSGWEQLEIRKSISDDADVDCQVKLTHFFI